MWTGNRACGVAAYQGIVGEAEPRATGIVSTPCTGAFALDIRTSEPRGRAGCSRAQRCLCRRTDAGQRGRASSVIGGQAQAFEVTRRARIHPVAFRAGVVPVLA